MPTVDVIFAFLAHDDEGEGIVCVPAPGGIVMPLVGADLARIESLRPYAQMVANARQRPVRLVYFGERREVEVLPPAPGIEPA